MKKQEKVRALSYTMAVSYAFLSVLGAFFVSIVVSDIPSFGVLLISFIFFVALVYYHEISFKTSSSPLEDTENVTAYDQFKLSAKIRELQDLKPFLRPEDLEKMSPDQMMQYLDSEINFLRTLYTEMEKYKEVSVSKKSFYEQPVEPELLKINKTELVESIKEALQAERIDILIQPIVKLPHRKPLYFECFSRIREKDDSILNPDNFLHLAKDESLISILDNTVLYRCIQMIRAAWKRGSDIKFFCNLSVKSLQNEKFNQSLIEFLKANPGVKQSLVLEFDGLDRGEDYAAVLPMFETLFNLGCVFSLDQIHDIETLDVLELQKCGFKYLKINSKTILEIVNTEKDEQRIIDLKRKADKKGVNLIVTHVEEEEELLQLLDFGFEHGQGYLFGKPQLNPF